MARNPTCCLLGFVVAAVLSGCGPRAATDTADRQSNLAADKHDGEGGHDHEAAGPHGGHLIVLGNDQFHAELLHDEPTHTVTVHLLDAAANRPVASDQAALTLQLFEDGRFIDHQLAAVRAADATEASEFKIVDEKLCDRLLHAHDVKGRLIVTIAGQPLAGTLEHDAHDDHDHGDHEGHDHEGHDHDDHGAEHHDHDGMDHPDGEHEGHDHDHPEHD